MASITPEDLKKVYRKEKDPKVRARMAAVNMVCMKNASVQDAARYLVQCPNWASSRSVALRRTG